jgi:hypothetical protein
MIFDIAFSETLVNLFWKHELVFLRKIKSKNHCFFLRIEGVACVGKNILADSASFDCLFIHRKISWPREGKDPLRMLSFDRQLH